MSGMRRVALLVCACLLMALSGCARSLPEPVVFFAMDTVMSVQLYGDDGSAAQAVEQTAYRLEKQLSRTVTDGDIVRVNAAAGKETAVDPETAALVARAIALEKETEGAFSVTLGAVADAWDLMGTGRIPTDTEREQALSNTGFFVKVEGDCIALANPEGRLDLGGIAKGYAVSAAADIARSAGITSGLINFGGNIALIGQHPDGGPFRIGLRDPEGAADSYFAVLELTDCVVATSGVYERYFEADGRAYGHILDPKSGAPADSGLLSVTVVCDDGARGDAFSTALYVLGLEKGMALCEQTDGVEAVFVTTEREVFISSGLSGGIELTGSVYQMGVRP